MSEGGLPGPEAAVEHDRDAVGIADKLEALKAQHHDLKRQLQRATKDVKNEARAGKFASGLLSLRRRLLCRLSLCSPVCLCSGIAGAQAQASYENGG